MQGAAEWEMIAGGGETGSWGPETGPYLRDSDGMFRSALAWI